MQFFLTVLAVLVLLCASELAWRKHWFSGELGRKFVHITVGCIVAFSPYWLTWDDIRLMSVAFLAVVILSKMFHIFQAVHSVQRPTHGEIFFAISVGLLTFITQNKGIYAASILQMALADGFAAIFGTKWGRGNTYRIFDHTKSIVGTAVFIAIAMVILLVNGATIEQITLGAILAAALENVAPLGLDNLLVPLSTCLILLS